MVISINLRLDSQQHQSIISRMDRFLDLFEKMVSPDDVEKLTAELKQHGDRLSAAVTEHGGT